MQALHMTETEGIGLEFRGQFTTRFLFICYCCSKDLFVSREDLMFMFDHVLCLREAGEEPLLCIKEEEALTKLAIFLANFKDLVIFSFFLFMVFEK